MGGSRIMKSATKSTCLICWQFGPIYYIRGILIIIMWFTCFCCLLVFGLVRYYDKTPSIAIHIHCFSFIVLKIIYNWNKHMWLLSYNRNIYIYIYNKSYIYIINPTKCFSICLDQESDKLTNWVLLFICSVGEQINRSTFSNICHPKISTL